MMFSLGKNITAKDDPLVRVDLQKLADIISGSSGELADKVRQLRTIHTLDHRRYAQQKLTLPYLVCAWFNPPFRKLENVAQADHLMLDLDHLESKELDPEGIKRTLQEDSRVVMAFVSPGGDGLKVLFRLDKPCHDPTQFQLFYKVFARKFAEQYSISQVIDPRTSDMTRACFLSHDPLLMLNHHTEPVCMDQYLDFENLHAVKVIASEIRQQERDESQSLEKVKKVLPGELLQEIKEKLNPNIRLREEKRHYVPEEIPLVMGKIEQALQENGIMLVGFENISYGRKIKVALGSVWAEINLFYGKRGYSVVKTPKRGCNEDLAEIAHLIVCAAVIQQHEPWPKNEP